MGETLTKVGRYQIVGELGRGSMGVVYRGFDPVIGRTIAVKTMLTEGLSSAEFQEYKARFQREAQTAGVLSHPSIVTVYDFGEENGLLYLAMECLEGESLEKVVEARNILPIETIIPIYEQVCSALDHAHAHQIVHRDIKPANIMILASGQVKVTDFGIAKMMTSGMTQAGQILGTPNYMSPEQVKGRPVDGRSDIFSLGVILYELVTGEKPFGGQNLTTVIYKIINENPIAPRELDSAIHPGLSYITSKSLAKAPEERYQTCRELAEDLKNYKNLGVSPAPSATVVMRAPQFSAPGAETIVDRATLAPTAGPSATEPEPARPLSVHVIPPAKPPENGASPVAWALLFLLVLGGLGSGYYFFMARSNPPVIENRLAPPATQPPAIPVTPAGPKLGGLDVRANVDGAKILLDGKTDPSWLTPHTFTDLPVGPHYVVLSKDGYSDTQQSVTVEEGRTNPLAAELAAKVEAPPEKTKPVPPAHRAAPAPRVGSLVVTSNIEGARITVDGRGDSDWMTPHTFTDLPAGSRSLTLAKDGYDTEYRSVTVEGGRTNSINIDLSVPTGEINIVTVPPGAEVTINGKSMGTAPLLAQFRVGQYHYTARLPGRLEMEGSIEVKKGVISTRSVTWPDASASATGIVEVRTIPSGAAVSVDGSPLTGRTPGNYRLPAGRHKLTLALSGYAPVERDVDVSASDATPVKVYVTLSRP